MVRTKDGVTYDISTHAPRTGSDMPHHAIPSVKRRFQPTLPARGATPFPASGSPGVGFQPTLPARGATTRPPDFL